MPKFRRLADDVIITVSGDVAVAEFAANSAYAPDPDEIKTAPTDDLDDRTVDDLRGFATEHGVDLSAAKLKADIVAAIRAHFAALPDRQDDGIDPA